MNREQIEAKAREEFLEQVTAEGWTVKQIVDFAFSIAQEVEMEKLRSGGRKREHHEDCDIHDTMISGKPCNCYLLFKQRLDDLEHKVAETASLCGVPHDNDFTADETLNRIVDFYADLCHQLRTANGMRRKAEFYLEHHVGQYIDCSGGLYDFCEKCETKSGPYRPFTDPRHDWTDQKWIDREGS